MPIYEFGMWGTNIQITGDSFPVYGVADCAGRCWLETDTGQISQYGQKMLDLPWPQPVGTLALSEDALEAIPIDSSICTASSQWFGFRPYLWGSWYNPGHAMGSWQWLALPLLHSPRHTMLTGTRIQARCTSEKNVQCFGDFTVIVSIVIPYVSISQTVLHSRWYLIHASESKGLDYLKQTNKWEVGDQLVECLLAQEAQSTICV